ncbi:response regulator transcription factor [Alteromonas sp. CI.11.F.A3]|uniref:response regulator transcription factor n=1 Tax=unclassified Alteromonas TaxID=2614992 RepID=UPI001B3A6DE2|nr:MULTISPECIES: response regulator transcription factor [unclassified Alteromonas]MBQ4828961.1 response regulator transcription factor [Alteromonas sp. MMG017]WOI37029.1 response regulator transcription factor [Alteromonas sp. CI.11.F.A3]
MNRVLLVEDDIGLAGNVLDYLELEDMQCDHASNGVAALQFINQYQYDVLVLDINLPRLDGFSVCERMRNDGNDTPVIMLTARDQLEDKLTGFKKGADDYLIKPFAMAELVARVTALAGRRSAQVNQTAMGNVTLNMNTQEAHANGNLIKLSPITYALLKKLLLAKGEVVSRERLIEAAWKDSAPESNVLKVHMHHLRKSLEQVNASISVLSKPNSGFYLTEDG